MNKKETRKEIMKLINKAHNNIELETLLEYGLTNGEQKRYSKLEEQLMALQETEVNK